MANSSLPSSSLSRPVLPLHETDDQLASIVVLPKIEDRCCRRPPSSRQGRTPHCRCWAALGTKTLFSARSSCQVVQSVRGGCVPLYDFHPAFRPVWGSQEVGVNTAPLHSRIFFQSSTLRRNVGHYAQRTTRGERSLPEAEYNGTVDRERVCPKWRKIRGILCQSCPEEKVRGTRRKICSPSLALGQYPDKGQSKALCTLRAQRSNFPCKRAPNFNRVSRTSVRVERWENFSLHFFEEAEGVVPLGLKRQVTSPPALLGATEQRWRRKRYRTALA